MIYEHMVHILSGSIDTNDDTNNTTNAQSSDKQSTIASNAPSCQKNDSAWEHFAFKKEGKIMCTLYFIVHQYIEEEA